MGKKKKYITQQSPFRNIEQLALYYCELAGVENFVDLKDTIYWNYYLEESKSFYKKRIIETKTISNVKETKIITCESCGKQLGAVIDGFVLLNLNYSFQHHKAPLKILCKCGYQNVFKEIIKFQEEAK